MIGKTAARIVALLSLIALGACQTARLGGVPPVGVPSPGPVYNAPEALEEIPPAPSGPVTSEPLAPPPGASGPVIAEVPGVAVPQPVETPRPAAAGGRSALIGSWTARDATGGSCRVQLSSSPALDLYRASAAGCGNKDLARLSAWDYRDGEVYLYQTGGSVAARLRGSPSALSGVLAKSGAPLSLSR